MVMTQFKNGLDSKFPLCCIDFFLNSWTVMRKEKLQFNGKNAETWFKDPNNTGRIYCPDCLIESIDQGGFF